MPEYLRALIIIVVLATAFFAFVQRPVCTITNVGDFTRRRNIWFALTLCAFLAHSFWIYILLAGIILRYAYRREENPPALFFFLLLVLPGSPFIIPGFGLMNFFFELSHSRMLVLFILLPAFIVLRRQGSYHKFGSSNTDKALIAYLLLTIVLFMRETSLTNNLRQVFYLFVDVFLPYFVISRSLKNMHVFRDTLLYLVLGIMVLAPLAVFEFYKQWLLYSTLPGMLGQEGSILYLPRDGLLRALATSGQPIVLGYLMVVGIGAYLFVQRFIQKKLIRQLGMLLMLAGLIAPLSRGPWIGAAVLLVVFMATGRYAVRNLLSMATMMLLSLTLVSTLPGGEKVINLLPFIGSTDKENVEYRERLISNSLIVIERNLWFGSVDYLKTPEMEAMRQGQGIIDMVNTYIGIALEKGVVGLGLFVTFFALTLLAIHRAMRLILDIDSEELLLGRVLMSTIISILVIIFSTSSIYTMSIIYWSVAGLGMAYSQMVRNSIAR